MRWVIAATLLVAGILAAVPTTRARLSESVTSLNVPRWQWLFAALAAEAGSMAAFARLQRRLFRAAGSDRVAIGSFMAITYAGNAISASVPVAGPGLSSAFFFRQFRHRGIDNGVLAWTMIVSSMVSSLALAAVLAVGALTAGSATGALIGLGEAVLFLLPAVALLAALRFPAVRRLINRVLAHLVARSRRLFGRPDPSVATLFEESIEKLVAIRVPLRKYWIVLALAVWNWVADFLCLVFAILATGAVVPWHGALLAYGAGVTAGSIGLTPGGVGVMEAALSGALVVAGMHGRAALGAVLIYRLISFWLVVTLGWVVMGAITWRQRSDRTAAPEVLEQGVGADAEECPVPAASEQRPFDTTRPC
jgi:uncharacterized protein (TIRG00374 family)